MSHVKIGDHWFIAPFSLAPHNLRVLVRCLGAVFVLVFLVPKLQMTCVAQGNLGQEYQRNLGQEYQPPASAVETLEQSMERNQRWIREQQEKERQRQEIQRKQEVERLISEAERQTRESEFARGRASQAGIIGIGIVCCSLLALLCGKRVQAARAQIEELKAQARESEAQIALLKAQIRELAKRPTSAEPETEQLKPLIRELGERLKEDSPPKAD